MFGKVIERVLFGAVIAYIAFNIWTFYEVFSPAECSDTKSCVFPGWSTSDKITARVSFSEAGGPVFRSFEVPEFDLQTGIKWVTNVKVSKKNFKDTDVICNIKVLMPSKVVILNKDVHVLTQRQRNSQAYNLLSSQKNDAHQNLHESAIHWLSELQVFLLKSPVSFPLNGIPREILPHFRVTYDRSSFVYPPLIHVNPQLQPASDWVELPDIPPGELNFTVQFMPLSIGKFRLRCMLEQTAEYLKNMGIKDKDVEDIRGIFTDTNLYLLLATVVVSILHVTVFRLSCLQK
uniref:Lipid scramblase CLPTM1L n=1 Tax=Mesocestoides corti TaxID=53468 RepID=A0A5K3F7J5_MESCO